MSEPDAREPLVLPPPLAPDPAQAPALRWGVIAPGGIARSFTRTLHAATRSRVVAVASRSLERARGFAAEHGSDADPIAAFDSVAAMLAAGGLDAVYVASPHAQHAELATQVLEAGIPVLVEKAFALSARQASDVLTLAEDRHVFCMEAMWTRFLPQADVLRSIVRSGLLGDIVLVRADHGQHFDIGPDHRLLAPELGGGALLDLGVYPVSFAQMLIGDLDDVAVRGSLTSTGVDADAAILARGRDGALAVLDSTQRAKTGTVAEVAGTLGTARLTGPFYAPATLTVTMNDGRTAEFAHPGDRDLGMAYEAAEVARSLAEGRLESSIMPWRDTVSVLQTLDTARAELGVVYPGEEAAR